MNKRRRFKAKHRRALHQMLADANNGMYAPSLSDLLRKLDVR